MIQKQPGPNLRDQRIAQFSEKIPGALDYKTLLYIGGKVKKRWPKGVELVDKFLAAGYKIDILEAFDRNVAALRHFNKNGRIFKEEVRIKAGAFRRIIQGDVRNIGKIRNLDPEGYDVVVFWHGPEHLYPYEIEEVVEKIEGISRRLVVFGCPFGIYHQRAVGGNNFEIHRSALYPVFFENLGFKTETLGERDVKKSHILAWKEIKKGEDKK